MEKRKRRAFTKTPKAEVVELVRKSGKSIGAVAKDLDLAETAVRAWARQAEVDAGRGPPNAADEEGDLKKSDVSEGRRDQEREEIVAGRRQE